MKNSLIHLSPEVCEPLKKYLYTKGYQLKFTRNVNSSFCSNPISMHPDIVYCHIGNGLVFHGNPEKLLSHYPSDCIYNGCSTGKYFIHKLKITEPALLNKCSEYGLKLIDVPQGYSRCSALPIDENSIITYDRGIARACRQNNGPEVLLIQSGFVHLRGYDTGFIGGTAGRIENEIIFNGDLSAHPDFSEIKSFILERKLTLKYFENEPLTDIGSIIEEKTALL